MDQNPGSRRHKQQQQRQVWQSSLEQLSGGQRTLISLALLLATANAECSNSHLLLLDEVDAALDEHNTRRVAGLLHQLAHAPVAVGDGKRQQSRKGQAAGATGGGCQILCVSHNKAFQGLCDGLLHVGKNSSSRAEEKEGDEKAGAGAVGHGKGGKGRKHGLMDSNGARKNARKVRFSVK